MNSMEALSIAQMIMRADWYYNMTDDYSAYKRGEASVQEVKSYINNRSWISEDVDVIKNEIKNILTLRDINKVVKQDTLDFWNNKIDNLFKKALENE
jgi:hypothetical protein